MTDDTIAAASEIDIDHLRSWIGREQEKSDVVTVRLVQVFDSIFDVDAPVSEGDDAPAGIHWCLAPDIVPMSGLGADGHPSKGGFLPPVPFPRRMWAGGELTYFGTFRVGDTVIRRSVIDDVALKTGKSGSLIFVTVRHEYSTNIGLLLRERQDIVYREQETGTAAARVSDTGSNARQPESSKAFEASPTLLFRYSAVTFNTHRIHYDMPYVTTEEHYPGLVVHGPMQATFLLRLAKERLGGVLPKVFSFRSVRPLFAGHTFTVNAAQHGGGHALWVAGADGATTMSATATS